MFSLSPCVKHLYFTTVFLLFSLAFPFLSQPLRNVNRCWLHFQSARSVVGQKNNWHEHLFSTRLGNWILFPNHTWESKTKRHYPLSFLLSQLKISTYSFHPVNPLCSVWLQPVNGDEGGYSFSFLRCASHLFWLHHRDTMWWQITNHIPAGTANIIHVPEYYEYSIPHTCSASPHC